MLIINFYDKFAIFNLSCYNGLKNYWSVISMEIDLSLTITSIIAIMALISPIITCIINNHYEIKKTILSK